MRPGLRTLLLLAGGCVDPEVGAPIHPTCNGADSDPSHATSFADIQNRIFAGPHHCVRCHTPSGATPIGLSIGGLDLSSAETLRHGGVQSGADIVIPGDSCSSLLVQKLGLAPPFGARMPLDGPPYLTPTELQLVIDWIAEGAHAE